MPTAPGCRVLLMVPSVEALFQERSPSTNVAESLALARAREWTYTVGVMGRGRPVTPRDLLDRKPFFEACASLSADAAILAVLVDHLAGRERIEVRPGDLVTGVGRRLRRRDASRPVEARFISERLRRLGFEPVRRDGRGQRYEIRWDQVWHLDPREVTRERVDVLSLGGAELLRLLAEEQGAFFAPRLWCPRCRRVTATLWGAGRERLERDDVHDPCDACAGRTELLDPGWLQKASARVRRAVRQDPDLLAEVKAEWTAVHGEEFLPALPEPFRWLNAVWARTGKPEHRPFEPLVCYQLAHAVDQLEAAGIPWETILEVVAEPNREKRLKLCARLSNPPQRSLAGSLTAALPSVNRGRLEEAVRWARRQWTNPMARVRDDRPARGKIVGTDRAI